MVDGCIRVVVAVVKRERDNVFLGQVDVFFGEPRHFRAVVGIMLALGVAFNLYQSIGIDYTVEMRGYSAALSWTSRQPAQSVLLPG